MKLPLRCTAFLAPIAITGLLAQQTSSTSPQVISSAQIESAELASINADSITFDIRLRVVPTVDARLKRIIFSEVTLNGVPVFCPPLEVPLELRKGVEVRALPSLKVQVFLRDLDSLKPVERMVESEQVEVRGRLRADLDLTFLQRLALLSSSVEATFLVQQTLTFRIPGGLFGKAAATSVLRAASLAGVSGRSGTSGWQKTLQVNVGPSIVCARTTYILRDSTGPHRLTAQTTGFVIKPHLVLLPAEAVLPWEFVPEIVSGLKDKILQFEEGSMELELSLGEPSHRAVLSLSRHEVRVRQSKCPTEKMIVLRDGKPISTKVGRRIGEDTWAVVEVTSPGVDPKPLNMVAEDGGHKWERLAVFRFSADADLGKARPEVILLGCDPNGERINCRQEVDSTGWGSPLLSSTGVVGVLQHENNGWSITSLLRKVERSL